MRLTWDMLIVVAMATSLTLYFRGVRRARIRWWEATMFVTGWLVIAGALLGPVDTLSDILFSVHMTQHELLMLIAAPLIVTGRPLIAGMWGLPARVRDAAIAWTRPLVTPWRALTNPMVVLVLHAIVLWSWHIPRAFEWALHNESVHAVQHLMFFITAALFWWSLIHGRFGRVGYGVAVFFVFLTAMHTGILGVLLTFARHVWYPTYAHTAPHALEDQQLAGLIMWIPAGVVFLIVGLALFAAWIGESERRTRSSALLLLLAFFVVRCSDYPGDRIAEAKQLTRGGDPDRGKTAIRRYGCGTCHTIPGVPGATATVGPPLDKLAMRGYLAGRLPNTPRNLMMWIREPQNVDPKTAMPNMNVDEHDGRDIAAYLLTLK